MKWGTFSMGIHCENQKGRVQKKVNLPPAVNSVCKTFLVMQHRYEVLPYFPSILLMKELISMHQNSLLARLLYKINEPSSKWHKLKQLHPAVEP